MLIFTVTSGYIYGSYLFDAAMERHDDCNTYDTDECLLTPLDEGYEDD